MIATLISLVRGLWRVAKPWVDLALEQRVVVSVVGTGGVVAAVPVTIRQAITGKVVESLGFVFGMTGQVFPLAFPFLDTTVLDEFTEKVVDVSAKSNYRPFGTVAFE